jgi:hypothetical protein
MSMAATVLSYIVCGASVVLFLVAWYSSPGAKENGA